MGAIPRDFSRFRVCLVKIMLNHKSKEPEPIWLLMILLKHLILGTLMVLVPLRPLWAQESVDNLLGDAVAKGNREAVEAALHQGAKVDARNSKGRTPLILAAQAGRLDIIKLLVASGADVNARTTTETGGTVLGFALEGNNREAVEYLIAHGAEIELRSRNGMTPLFYAASTGQDDMIQLLLSKGANLNVMGLSDSLGNYLTPLMIAGIHDHPETLKLLVAKGAKVDKRNNVGATALMEIAKRPQPGILKLLIERGADVNARSTHGQTALMYAASNGQLENIKLLLAAGADTSATATDDPDPDTQNRRYNAADLARQQGHEEALALLRDAPTRPSSAASMSPSGLK
jgi:ankyrin repeat protein